MAELWFERRNRATGDVVRGALPLTDGLGIEARYAEVMRLTAALIEDAPPLALAIEVICDGCGRMAPLKDAQAPPGWTTADGRDLCAGCAS